jgi:hypothetical protein
MSFTPEQNCLVLVDDHLRVQLHEIKDGMLSGLIEFDAGTKSAIRH